MADHIAEEFENVSASCDEIGRVRKVAGRNSTVAGVMPGCVEGRVSYV